MTSATFPAGTVMVDPLPHLESVTVSLWVASGSRNEAPQARGSAHLVEHLVSSTRTREGSSLLMEADTQGGRAEAVTTPEYTLYAATVPARRWKHVLGLLQQGFAVPDFTSEAVELQKTRIVDEIEQAHGDPATHIHDLALSSLLGDHPLAYPARGRTQDIRDLSVEDAAREHRRQSRSKSFFVVSGGVDPAEARDALGSLDMPEQVPDHPAIGLIPPRAQATSAHHRSRSPRSHVLVTWLLPDRTPADDLPLAVMNRLVGGSVNGVLQRAFEGSEGAYSCHTYRSVFSDCAVWSAYASCAPASVENTIRRIESSLEKAWDEDLNDSTAVEKATLSLEGSLAIGFESTRMRANWLGRRLLDGASTSLTPRVERRRIDPADLGLLRSRFADRHVTVLDAS